MEIFLKKLGLNEIREKYLSFFESKAHFRMPSFSLVPENDASLLLINAGMAPLKPYFTGRQTPPSKRVTTCQKCIRTPDIERVGKTARHGTFFEMLGNFSFGDYFKKDATKWAWEFATEVMELDPDRLWVTIYEEDDDAFDIWTNHVGIPAEKIVRMGKEDNFWEIGTGPCGPCSELYYDRGIDAGCGSPDCKVGCECDRFVEFWNLVFTQFDKQEDGTYVPLDNPNIDTGMGLERIACIMQGVLSIFDVDTIANILNKVCEMSGKKYKENADTDVSIRVVTDHIRSTVFMVSDGVRPSNEGRGYVLRRLLRRAARHGRLLGIEGAFLSVLADTVIDESYGAYPELKENRETIKNIIKREEERFMQTIDAGFSILEGLIENMKSGDVLAGGDAFKLYDTYGFPIDLTREIVAEKGIGIDEEGFAEEMNLQRKRARDARAKMGEVGWDDKIADLLAGLDVTEFVGYDDLKAEGKIIAIISDGEKADSLSEGMSGYIIFDKTPFYAEGGGETGDVGKVSSKLASGDVTDTKKTADGKYYHFVTVTEGSFSVGETAELNVCQETRMAVSRNHSVTHLLHKALKNRLGAGVGQAGSLVTPDRMRFDFTSDSGLTAEDLKAVEAEVNKYILEALPVSWNIMPIDEAKKLGATAMFGDKYGADVRVVTMGDYSMELCGGCHVKNTSQIGLCKILSETGVAAGVRRIEAVTGKAVLDELYSYQNLAQETAETLKCAPSDISKKAQSIMAELKEISSKCESLTAKLATGGADDILKNAKEINGVTVMTGVANGAGIDGLRALGDSLKEKFECALIALCDADGDKVTFVTMATDAAVKKGVHAGKIIKEMASLCGGGGGGRPDSAQAGGKDKSKAEEALNLAYNLV